MVKYKKWWLLFKVKISWYFYDTASSA